MSSCARKARRSAACSACRWRARRATASDRAALLLANRALARRLDARHLHRVTGFRFRWLRARAQRVAAGLTVKSYFLEKLMDEREARRWLGEILPGQTNPWL